MSKPDVNETDELQKQERDALSTLPPDVFVPESQRERWVKYGVNVGASTLAVVLLAVFAIWLFNADKIHLFKHDFDLKVRKDMTGSGSNELKPQTVEILKKLPQEVTLVSLYPKLKKEDIANKGEDTYQKVRDKLEEYARSSKNVKTEYIDPVSDPPSLDRWLGEVKLKYGANTEKYTQFVKEFPATLEDIKKQTKAEDTKLQSLLATLNQQSSNFSQDQIDVIYSVLQPAFNIVQAFPGQLEQLNTAAKQELEGVIPNYAGAVNAVKAGLSPLSRSCGTLVERISKLKDNANAPDAVKQWAAEAAPKFEAIKAKADEALKKTENLGQIKLNEVREKIVPASTGDAASPAIVVMGPDDVKVIEDNALWSSGQSTGLVGRSDEKPRLRFAGEQKITSSILSLMNPTKTKVVFVRAGGQPLLTAQGLFGPEPGDFSAIAERLRAFNFEVLEKDLMAGQNGAPPTGEEVSDEVLKSAIWVVFPSPSDPRMGAMPGMLGERLKQHLDEGGSALCLMASQAEDLAPALKEWGIEASPNTLIVHEAIPSGNGGQSNDYIEQARRQPQVFVFNDFGDHPAVAQLRTLDAAFVGLLPVKKMATVPAGVTVSEILPIPQVPTSWGESDVASMRPQRRGDVPPAPTFDKATDTPNTSSQPLHAGAAAEKQGKGRLVVIGSQFFFDQIVGFPDQTVYEKSKMVVPRFPANGELITNTVFWLAHNDEMAALGPSSLDAARIDYIKPGLLGFLKYGLLVVILPLMGLLAGVWVWYSRRG